MDERTKEANLIKKVNLNKNYPTARTICYLSK